MHKQATTIARSFLPSLFSFKITGKFDAMGSDCGVGWDFEPLVGWQYRQFLYLCSLFSFFPNNYLAIFFKKQRYKRQAKSQSIL